MNWDYLWCLIFGHKYEFVSRTGDWLKGGVYTYRCYHCKKYKTARRWKV